MKNLKNKNGFTLTELLIVFLIMGIVMAVAIPSYNALVSSATVKTCGDMQAIIVNTFNTKYAYSTKKVVGVKYRADGKTAVKKLDPLTNTMVDANATFEVTTVNPGTITIQTGPTGQYLDCNMGTTGIDKEEFREMFINKIVPCCTTPNHSIKITITWPNTYSKRYNISVACYNIDGVESPHKPNEEALIKI